MTRALIGLGSNLGEPQQQLIDALHALDRLPALTLRHHSRLFSSAPIGPQDQPDFVNAAAAVDTTLAPLELLHTLQALELAAGRQRRRHWGERTLDLDILLLGDHTIASEELTVPHPQLTQRAFVLLPLLDIAPGGVLPDGTALDTLIAQVTDQQVTALSTLEIDALIRQSQNGAGQARTPRLL